MLRDRSNRPRLLDVFCGAGGCSVGYYNAGFEVVGVDIKPQPNYPFEFHQWDAMEVLSGKRAGLGGGPVDPDDFSTYLEEWAQLRLSRFDAIHASPPCQHYAAVTAWRGDQADHPDLVDETRSLLDATGLPWVMENVPEAPIRRDFLLCGSMFGLKVRRHRAFETSWHHFALAPTCGPHQDLLPFEHKGERAYADAMGCDWMTAHEAREAIPPAYTQHIGGYLMTGINGLERAA